MKKKVGEEEKDVIGKGRRGKRQWKEKKKKWGIKKDEKSEGGEL